MSVETQETPGNYIQTLMQLIWKVLHPLVFTSTQENDGLTKNLSQRSSVSRLANVKGEIFFVWF